MIRFGLLGRGRIANHHDLLGDGSVKGAVRATIRNNVPERTDTGPNQLVALTSLATEEGSVYDVRPGLRPEQFPNAHSYQSCVLSLSMSAEIAIAQQTAVIDLVRTFD
ncbi:hypothetical protein [Bradyrhizobium genosp. SA-3]|uniref:hypothetical protein n=1 Tax=Bradyrhizobium genosp. SA-3 TaxID=508868 RepID=UPI0013EEA30A|nr:hypothetical protein [Bradyrhizobium genosp. SA-3]